VGKIDDHINELEIIKQHIITDPIKGFINNPEQFIFDKYKLYYRVNDRNSSEYRLLKKLINNRDIDIVYPKGKGWYDADVDREIWSSDFNFLAREEYKYTYDFKTPFTYPDYQRDYLSKTLGGSYFWLNGSISNFSCDKHGINRGQNGKGVILYKFYTANLEYFSIINFTGADLNLVTHPNLNKVAGVIEPWASELLNFLIEAWIRQDYGTVADYLKNGVSDGRIKSNKAIDQIILTQPDELMERIEQKFKIEEIMTDIMDIIHFETLVNDPVRYVKFVEGIRKGQLII